MKVNTSPCYSRGEPWKHDAKWKKSDTKVHILYDSTYEMSKVGKSIEPESQLVVTRERGEMGLTANRYGTFSGMIEILWNR